MKLITRGELLQLDGEVLYSKYRPQVFSGFEIKLGNSGDNDWVTDSLDAGSIRVEGSEDNFLKLNAMETDPALELEMDFNYSGRDGLYDSNTDKIALYDEQDTRMLIARLQRLLPEYNNGGRGIAQLLTREGAGLCSPALVVGLTLMGITTVEQFMALVPESLNAYSGLYDTHLAKEAEVHQLLIRRYREDRS